MAVPSAVEGLEQAMAPSRSVRARALLASLLLLLAETDALHLALASRGATRLLICAQRPAALVMETIVACRLGCRLCRARSLVFHFERADLVSLIRSHRGVTELHTGRIKTRTARGLRRLRRNQHYSG